ncbi:MAG: DNA polymerase III subunit gamma/tau [Pleurocapsa sp. MO_226.B13]|nr:DNA polymerase III subunit gamma/tau [Pleurocapsa sp. MO_226.B13]
MNLPIKYRPLRFDQVVGQSVAVEIAKASLAQPELQTTFLLVGASGSGKTTLARIMARALNCTNHQGIEPCNQCDSCQSHLQDRHLAITEINGADKNGVDDVREIIERCQLHAIGSKYRVLIVDECHQMSKSAQNAMLKLLEDPPQDTIFLLCTTEEEKLLETIRSRSRILRFQTVDRDLVTGYLLNVADREQIPLTEPEAHRIYEYNKGSLRQCLQTLGTLSDRVTVEDLCPQVPEVEIQSLLIAFNALDYFSINNILQRVTDKGFYPQRILVALIDYLIGIMAMKDTAKSLTLNADRVLSIIIPAANKLGSGSNAIINCRLALYEAATVWQPMDVNEGDYDPTSQTEVQPQPQSQPQIQYQPQPQSQYQMDERAGERAQFNNYQHLLTQPANYEQVNDRVTARYATQNVTPSGVQSEQFAVNTNNLPNMPNGQPTQYQPGNTGKVRYQMPLSPQTNLPYSSYPQNNQPDSN